MPKAKPIDRVEYTKRKLSVGKPAKSAKDVAQDIYAEAFDRCPECGKSLIHESGCLRCTCGWSKC